MMLLFSKNKRRRRKPYLNLLRQGTDRGFWVMADCNALTAVFESKINGVGGWNHKSSIGAESARPSQYRSPTMRDCIWPWRRKLLTCQHVYKITVPRTMIIWSNILLAVCGFIPIQPITNGQFGSLVGQSLLKKSYSGSGNNLICWIKLTYHCFGWLFKAAQYKLPDTTVKSAI